jgi:adenine-specific DNA-methyltransferase
MPEKNPPKKTLKKVETIVHDEASRRNIPTAEYQSLIQKEYQDPLRVAYERRNRDLDPQLVWRGKDEQDWSDLVVNAPPIYIQEKVHPKVLVDDLVRRTKSARDAVASEEADQFQLFADFNGLPSVEARTEFYQHDANWTNRMILGDSLQVMASLAEREGLRGQVQCIYIDPPYGIKFNSNFQWSTTSRDVQDGNSAHISREPEQVRAFRDTWNQGVHSYLTYLRDRLTASRDLLADSGSIFVQIGEENAHRLRIVLDEVFGDVNFVSQIAFRKTTGKASGALDNTCDYLLWYCKNRPLLKFRSNFDRRSHVDDLNVRFLEEVDGRRRPMTKEEALGITPLPEGARAYRYNPLTSARSSHGNDAQEYKFEGKSYTPGKRTFSTNIRGLHLLDKAGRLFGIGKSLTFVRYFSDFAFKPQTDIWDDTRQSGFGDEKLYVVQTASRVIERCLLMTTDPGDLVLDPTCGSGTSAYVAEQWGRRWIAIDTSRVALALARARIMGARYPFYLLADSTEGKAKEAEIRREAPTSQPTHGDIRHGFVYERVPHITLKAIANNSEIDVIWEKFQQQLEPLRESLNKALKQKWEEWQIPREAQEAWPKEAKSLHAKWWEQRIARQKEIDASIAAKADYEYLYDTPYDDKSKVRVAGPFTVESLSPHRVLGVNENDELIDGKPKEETRDFVQIILESLRTAGVQQAHKEDKIDFSTLTAWPGSMICAEGTYAEGTNGTSKMRRAAILVGPEFGTVSRPDLVEAAREAADAGFDALIACAFNFDAHSSEFNKLGRMPVLKARMNADLHMAEDLKNTGKGNLFVIFGEPDIDLLGPEGGKYRVKIKGVDVFHPATGEVRSDGPEGIACWFLDTDYNEESFFVRHAYFLGANDPYKALKTTLKAEVDEEAWATLRSDVSRPFDKPESGRIAVKVINHLGDEVMKVFRIG